MPLDLDPNDPMVQAALQQSQAERQQQAIISSMVTNLAMMVYAQIAMAHKSQEKPLELNDGRRLAASAINLAEEYAPFFLEHIGLVPPLPEPASADEGDSSPIVTTGD